MTETKLTEEAAKVEADVQAASAALHKDLASAEGYVKTHVVWLIGGAALVVGWLIGHFV